MAKHHTRDDIMARFREGDSFTIDLAPDDTAWDPETGDTLIGGVIVHYRRGEFPGTAYRAQIVAMHGDTVATCPHCRIPVIVGRMDGERRTVHHHAGLDEAQPLCAGSLAVIEPEA